MKNFVFAMMFAASTAMAQPVKLAESHDGDEWFGYPETMSVLKDGYSMLVGKRVPGEEESRMFFGVEASTCTRRFGTVYARKRLADDWEPVAEVVLNNTHSVADSIAHILCDVASQKPNTKGKSV
jgi:hypothetical protein